jgi:ribosomal silencing factor RsfS
VDFNDVMIHIFLDQVREYYNLEGLYAKGLILEPVWENKASEQEGA